MYCFFNQHYSILEDKDLMLRFYQCGVKMVAIPQNIAFYRMSGVSNIKYKEGIEELRKILLAHWDGESEDIREKIEKSIEESLAYAEIQKNMNKVNQDLGNTISKMFYKENDYVIFGVGDYGVKCLQVFSNNGCSIESFVDNDSIKWSSMCGNIEIKSPEYLRINRKNVIVANIHYKEEILKQLEGMGYQYGVDCIFMEDILRKMSDML